MDKLLLIIDSMKPDIAAIDFGCYMAGLTNSRLTGIFLENLDFEEVPAPKTINGKVYLGTTKSTAIASNEEKRMKCNESIEKFKAQCSNNQVHYAVHRDRSVPLEELKMESKFADLLMIDAETTFTKNDTGSPTLFVKEVLDEAKCPVIIINKDMKQIDELVFVYDGSDSAIYSIKQFAYLFPEMRKTTINVVQVAGHGTKITARQKIKEWLEAHFDQIVFTTLDGDEFETLQKYLAGRKNALLIIDSLYKPIIDTIWSKPGNADIHGLPLFISNHFYFHY
ncbi:MAG: hypothetical protein JSS96_02535 [Bacteroidetes bacterium]|nr:hypothetical protein [Bacteroidota bacterium]